MLLDAIRRAMRSRKALNGLARGLVALALLLIVRRIDDVLGQHLNDVSILVLSSVVVIVFWLDVKRIDDARDLYALWQQARKQREHDLETRRANSEQRAGAWAHQGEWARRVRSIGLKKRASG